MSKSIVINSVFKSKNSDRARLSFNIILKDENETIKSSDLWFETKSEYYDFLCEELIDGVAIIMLSYAMRGGYDIVSEIPISEELYYNLAYHVIPQLCSYNKDVHPTCIKAPVVHNDFKPKAVAAGMSCGVDSFCTLFEYTEECKLENYKLTHLTYFENGAHHVAKGNDFNKMKQVFNEQLAVSEKFCKEYNFELITMWSNVNEFLSKFFWMEPFELTHTYRNIGMAMLIQKLIRTYYYSSALNIDDFTPDLRNDSAYYEKYMIPHIRTGAFFPFSSNKAMTRLEKTVYISDFEASHKYLNVCFMSGHNCGKCKKCIRTLTTLDVIGKLEKYSEAFDIDYYKKNKNWYYTSLCYRKGDDIFADEILKYAKSKNITIPLKCKIKGKFLYLLKVFFGKVSKCRLIRKAAYKVKPY